jgi:hypothetical protein
MKNFKALAALGLLLALLFTACQFTQAEPLTQRSQPNVTSSEQVSTSPIAATSQWGFIDKTGKIVVEPRYQEVYSFSEGLAVFNAGSSEAPEYGYIDKTGKVAIQPQFSYASSLSEGLALVKNKGKYGYIDKKGKVVIEPKYEQAGSFSEGLAQIIINKKGGYINKNGKVVITPKFGYVSRFSEGLALVSPDGEMGIYGSKYQDLYDIEGSDTVTATSPLIKQKYGYINQQGKYVISPKYDHGRLFHEGVAKVGFEGKK